MSNKLILALGADIKNRFSIGDRRGLAFGPDIGDLQEAKNYELLKDEINKAVRKKKPKIIACDLHPGYFSSRFARELKVPNSEVRGIQHHHAHIGSVIREHNLKRPLIGVAFDGTGYGTDGNMWGGEFFTIDKKGFKRSAHLKYYMMPGGDKVVSEPWRITLAILGEKAASLMREVGKSEKDMVLSMLSKKINSPLSSGAGRIFDGAAALLGISAYASYEAEGPIKLEAMCRNDIKGAYEFKILKKKDCSIIDTKPLFSGMVKDLRKKVAKDVIATKFHNSIVNIIVKVVKKLSKAGNIKRVALSGGVFQNKFLRTRVINKLAYSGFQVYTNIKTPMNDLNISLGQYYVSCNTCKD